MEREVTYTPTREDKAASILVEVYDNHISTLRDQINTLHLALGHDHFRDDNYAKHL